MTYWMPLLYIKHGISVMVTPLKLLGGQFADMLQDNGISAVSMTASNATDKFNLLYLGLYWLCGHWSLAQFLHHNTLELHTDTPAAPAVYNVCQRYVVHAVDCCTAL
jgi:hypothetical protein